MGKKSLFSVTWRVLKFKSAYVFLFAGQSYEIKLKRLGDLSEFQGKYLRVSFSERFAPDYSIFLDIYYNAPDKALFYTLPHNSGGALWFHVGRP